MKTGAVIAPLALLCLLGTAFIVWEPVEPVPTIQGAVLPVPKPLPAFTLTDHNGQIVAREDLPGRWHLVSYGFTFCPDVCPTLLADLARFNTLLKKENRYTDLQIWFYTIDPARDSPAALANYVPWFDPAFVGLRAANEEQAETFEESLGIQASTQGDPESEDYQVSHGFRLFLLDDQGRLQAALAPTRTREGEQFFEAPVLLKDYLALRRWADRS